MAKQGDALEGELTGVEEKDVDIFEALKDFIKSAGRFKGLVDTRSEWYENFRPSSSVSLYSTPSNILEDARLLREAQEVKSVIESARQVLSSITKWSSTQYLDCKDQIASLKMRISFRSLPDEVLSQVLEFAAYCTPKERGDEYRAIARTLEAANNLGHVCTRFRRLIVASPCLWDRIRPDMHPDMISLSLARCGDKAEIYLTDNTSYWYRREDLDDFVSTIIRNVKCWRGLVVDFRHMNDAAFAVTPRSDRLKWYDRLLKAWSESTQDLDAPFLTSLEVEYPNTVILSEEARGRMLDEARVHFYRSWTTPKLRCMTARNIIPLPFSGTNSLVSFSISLSFDLLYSEHSRLNIRPLANFLLSCAALEEIKIELTDCGKVIEPAASPDRLAVMTNVSVVELRLQDCELRVVESLTKAITFPNVSAMDVYIDASSTDRDTLPSATGSEARSVVESVFPSTKVFPSIKRLRFAVDVKDHLGKSQSISLPFPSLPALEHLEVNVKRTQLAPIPDDIILPSLRSLTMTNCEEDWMKSFVRRLRDQAPNPSLSHALQLVVDGERLHPARLLIRAARPNRRFW